MLFTWYSYDPDVDGDSSGIAARIGTAQGDGSIAWDSTGEFTVNAEVQSTQAFPQVTQLSDGQVLFTWTSADPDVDGDNYGIAARVLDLGSLGVPENTPIDIDITTSLDDTDGSETLAVKLMGFPDGATFSLGSLQGSEWVIDDAGDIASLATTPLTMTPPQDYNGAFTLAVEGEVIDMATLTTGAASDTTSITKLLAINVIPGNSAPEAVDDNYVTDEDHALNVGSLPGVIANDTDIDGDALTAALVTGASSGTLGLNADGSFSYRPNADFNGTDSFTYMANDGGSIPTRPRSPSPSMR